MRTLTKSEAKRWCQTQGATLGHSGLPDVKGKAKSFVIPTDAGKRVALVAEQLKAFGNGKTLVWFDDWRCGRRGSACIFSSGS
jgi:hypothetical protein